jgi:hypothetical protein
MASTSSWEQPHCFSQQQHTYFSDFKQADKGRIAKNQTPSKEFSATVFCLG